MLVYKLTTKQVWTHFGIALFRIALGIGSGIYLLNTIWSADLNLLANFALVVMAALSFLDVYQQAQRFTEFFVLRAIRTRFIATPTALAIKAPGSPAEFLRKDRCVGYKMDRHTYITDEDDEVPVLRNGFDSILTFPLEFLQPFFDLWWPDIPQDKAKYYLSKVFPEPSTLQYYLLGLIFVGSLAITALFMWHTSALGALLLYPIVAQVVFRIYRLLPGRTLAQNDHAVLPVPGQWMAHVEQLERERLERLGISNPEAFLWDNRPKLHVERLKEHQKWRRFQFALVTTALAFLAMFAAFWAFERNDREWVLDNLTLILLPVGGILLSAVAAWVPMMTGSIHDATIVNSRTIAAKRRYGPIVYYKKRDCEGCTHLGTRLVFRDGKRLTLVQEAIPNEELFTAHLAPYYSLWFPETTLESIKANQTRLPQPRWCFALKWAIILAPLLVTVPVAFYAFDVQGTTLLVIASLSVATTLALLSLLSFGRSTRFICKLPVAPVPAEAPEAEYAED